MSQVPTTERRSVTSQLAAVMGAVIALAASFPGCKGDVDCVEDDVVCAYELTIDTSGVAEAEPKNTVTWTVSYGEKTLDMSNYIMKVVVETPSGTREVENNPTKLPFSQEPFLTTRLPNEYHKATFKVDDVSASAGTVAQRKILCFDKNGEKQDCQVWEENKKNAVTVIDSEDKVKERSQSVKCVKFTYTRTEDQDDFTWVVKSTDNYNFPSVPSVMGSTTSASVFTSTGGGAFISTNGGFPVTIDNGTVIMSTTPLSMRLPFPPSTSWVDLKEGVKDTLRAGFTVITPGVAGNYTMGCNILQKTLKSILAQALDAAFVTPDQMTLHILFPTSDYAYIAGDHGWCYKLSPTGQTPLLTKFDSSTIGTECVVEK